MSASTAPLSSGAVSGARTSDAVSWLRSYFFSDSRRSIQTLLGLIWLLVGGLQFQSFMYGNGFIQLLKSTAAGQPHWAVASINWGANTMHAHPDIYNTLAALIQVAIGFGILYRRTTKPAILLSFAWAFGVWWFGEGFGMLLANAAMPLTGAPGAVVLYALIGAIVWPNDRPGGLLGVLGARIAWAALWLMMAYLWLLPASNANNTVHAAINAAPSGMSWLSSLQVWAANLSNGGGFGLALVLAVVSAAIGIAVLFNWRAKEFLILAATLNLIYWLVGQGLGGMFAGGATDPNAGPLFILLAYALYTLVPYTQPIGPAVRTASDRRQSTLAGE